MPEADVRPSPSVEVNEIQHRVIDAELDVLLVTTEVAQTNIVAEERIVTYKGESVPESRLREACPWLAKLGDTAFKLAVNAHIKAEEKKVSPETQEPSDTTNPAPTKPLVLFEKKPSPKSIVEKEVSESLLTHNKDFTRILNELYLTTEQNTNSEEQKLKVSEQVRKEVFVEFLDKSAPNNTQKDDSAAKVDKGTEVNVKTTAKTQDIKLDLRKITRSQSKSAKVDNGLTEGEVALATSREGKPLPPDISWSGDGGDLRKSSKDESRPEPTKPKLDARKPPAKELQPSLTEIIEDMYPDETEETAPRQPDLPTTAHDELQIEVEIDRQEYEILQPVSLQIFEEIEARITTLKPEKVEVTSEILMKIVKITQDIQNPAITIEYFREAEQELLELCTELCESLDLDYSEEEIRQIVKLWITHSQTATTAEETTNLDLQYLFDDTGTHEGLRQFVAGLHRIKRIVRTVSASLGKFALLVFRPFEPAQS